MCRDMLAALVLPKAGDESQRVPKEGRQAECSYREEARDEDREGDAGLFYSDQICKEAGQPSRNR